MKKEVKHFFIALRRLLKSTLGIEKEFDVSLFYKGVNKIIVPCICFSQVLKQLVLLKPFSNILAFAVPGLFPFYKIT